MLTRHPEYVGKIKSFFVDGCPKEKKKKKKEAEVI
jgi:hypothetical protein